MCPGGMQFHPSRGQRGWRRAGRAVGHCPPGDVAPSSPWHGPRAVAGSVGWKTSSHGSSQVMKQLRQYKLCPSFSLVGTCIPVTPELLSQQQGEDGRSKPRRGFRGSAASPNPSASITVSKLPKPPALPCLHSISSRDVLSMASLAEHFEPQHRHSAGSVACLFRC